MTKSEYIVRPANAGEFQEIGSLMVTVYSQLDGFPKPSEIPDYYQMLQEVGALTKKPGTELLVAASTAGGIAGAVVYFDDMRNYGSGGIASDEKNASGFRLLAVDPAARGLGIGKLLVKACIERAREKSHRCIILHTTKSMMTAWKMYEGMGFVRSEDLDFAQGDLPIFGFRMKL
jgi:GNAT superfamily N-acetyltransferase